jgi:iron-sulfur cluster repair protein YtfE (RIC family)
LVCSAADDPGAWLSSYGGTAPILERHGVRLGMADLRAAEDGVEALLDDLALGALPRPSVGIDGWSDAPIDELVLHIVAEHHGYMRAELARLARLARLLTTSLPASAVLDGLQSAINLLRQTWLAHLVREESELFPHCLELTRWRRDDGRDRLERLLDASHHMTHDHRELSGLDGRVLERVTTLERSGQAGHAVLTALRNLLQAMAADRLAHTSKEDDILVPAVLFAQEMLRAESERSRSSRRSALR